MGILFELPKKNWLLFFSLMVIVGCSSKKQQEPVSFNEKNVNEVSVLLDADSSNTIAQPAWIKSVSDGFLIYDIGLNKISKFDLQGHKLLSFGRKGRGPGEFLSVGGFWMFNDTYLVYDINSLKLITYDSTGNLITDIPLQHADLPEIHSNIEAITPKQFVMPSAGKDGTLLALVNTASGNIHYFGKAVSKEYTPSYGDKMEKAISEGKIPSFYRNSVLLSHNQTGIFVFQETTALLQKYSLSGKLIWQKNVKIPAIAGLIKHVIKENRKRIKEGKFPLDYSYADAISANKEGVAVMLHMPKSQPVTIAWVPNDGEQITVITYPAIKFVNPTLRLLRFALSDSSYVLFSSTLGGKIYKAYWPER